MSIKVNEAVCNGFNYSRKLIEKQRRFNNRYQQQQKEILKGSNRFELALKDPSRITLLFPHVSLFPFFPLA